MHDRSSAADPQAPLAAGRYRVDFALGQDGMGTVYAVTEVSTASWRSKRPRTDGGRAESTARASDQLHREYHLLAELSHPSIIRVFAYGLDDDGPFYTMELLSGHSLAQEGVLDGRRTCELARDIASSLAVIHARRLVHRDVTLGNIHNDAARGRCKLLDFGAVMSSGIPASVVGTPPYLPPQVSSIRRSTAAYGAHI